MEDLEYFEDKKGWGYLCPICKSKCYVQATCLDGWVIECDKCDYLIDED